MAEIKFTPVEDETRIGCDPISPVMPITWTNGERRLGDLIGWKSNPRKIKREQAKRLEGSIRKFGYSQLCEIEPDGTIIDGHQREQIMSAMEEYGPDAVIDVRVASRKLTDQERKEYIALKHRGATGEFDWDAMHNLYEPQELLEWGFDAKELEVHGFEFEEEKPKEDPGPQVDKAAELLEKWQVRPGQLWRLGEHRLICGDCNAVDDAFYADCHTLFYDPEWDEGQKPAFRAFDDVLSFCDGSSFGYVIELFGAPTWVFAWDCVTSWYTPNRPLRRMKNCLWYGDVHNYQFDGWHYGDSGEERTVRNTRGEYVFKPDPRGKHLSDVFSQPITKLHAESEHSHSKPIDWVTLLIANCTRGDVFDPFLGSGTSLIACERLGRKCRAIEISPAFCAVAIQRWADMTGQEPQLLDPPKMHEGVSSNTKERLKKERYR
jgi:hypothetical protein